MEKIILISIDDGTVYDEKLVALLNRHGIPATFNLNSGLKDFVWQYEGLPVRRCDCTQVQEVYKGHEVASHTLHHPCLTELNLAALQWEIREDCKNLCAAFSLEERMRLWSNPAVWAFLSVSMRGVTAASAVKSRAVPLTGAISPVGRVCLSVGV